MSILLEALRKSEKKQRTREVPTINSEVQSYQPSGALRLAPMVLMLAVALVISGWFVWQQYRPPDDQLLASVDGDSGTSSQPDEPGSAGTVASTGPVVQAGGASGETESAGSKRLVVDESVPFSSPAGLKENDQGARPRTPMENYKAPTSGTTNEANEDKAKDLQSSPQPEQKKPPRASRFANKSKPANDFEPGESVQVDSPKPANLPREPAPITYWELPDSIRADVPEIKYTVLVYNKNPAERFVLINGERLAEGDSPLPGLKVKEIRRDGVIFSYRLYQFLVER